MKKVFILIILLFCFTLNANNEIDNLIKAYQISLNDMSNYLTIGYEANYAQDDEYPIPSHFTLYTRNKNHLTSNKHQFIRLVNNQTYIYSTCISIQFIDGKMYDENNNLVDLEIINETEKEILCYLYESENYYKRLGKYYNINKTKKVEGKLIKKWLQVSNVDLFYYATKQIEILKKVASIDRTYMLEEKIKIYQKIIELEKNKKYRIGRFWNDKTFEEWVNETRNEVLDTNIDNLKL
jgi:hypothetical protein